MAVEYFTCSKCQHPYAIVGRHHCERQADRHERRADRHNDRRPIKSTIDGFDRSAPSRTGTSSVARPHQASEIAAELMNPSTTFDRANDLIDMLQRVSYDIRGEGEASVDRSRETERSMDD